MQLQSLKTSSGSWGLAGDIMYVDSHSTVILACIGGR
jgi:hypothetical protein